MARESIDVYYFNTSDYHLSEYVPAYFKTIQYFSNFSGSLATLLVDRKEAYLFVDGRYHIQADKQAGIYGIKIVKLGTEGAKEPIPFILDHYGKDVVVGLDGRRTSTAFGQKLIRNQIVYKSIDIYSKLIENRPALENCTLKSLPIEVTGKSRKDKIRDLLYCLGDRCHIVDNLECISYLLNLRGRDIAYTPVFLAYLVIYRKDIYLFTDIERLSDDDLDSLFADEVIIRPYDSYYEFIKGIRDSAIIMDFNKTNFETYCKLLNKGNQLYDMRSPIEDMKSVKNKVEIDNSRLAHIYDGVAMVRFIKWLKEIDKTTINEYDAANKANEFRLGYKAYDLSFSPIVAYNANAAMMHYSPTADDNAMLDNSGILLIDSGGQYDEGTTDITRTISLGATSQQLKKHFTLVLKSMFNLSEVKFLKGMSGCQLDILARKDLWNIGINYRCGTGHGVGHLLSVHEGPPNVRFSLNPNGTEAVPLRAGNILSDEPGVYLEGEYGIRCENELLCKYGINNEYGQFMEFETLTMCPFDLDLIDKDYLDDVTIKALNSYHKKVYETLLPYLSEEEAAFLREATRSI